LAHLNGGGEAQIRTQFVEGSVDTVVAVDCAPADERELVGPSADYEPAIESTFEAGETIEDRLENSSPNAEHVGANEWQTSVATWDPDWDSNSEWPLLVVPSSERSYNKPRLAIAAVAAIAILIAVAGLYFLIYRSPDSQERQAFDAAVEARAGSVASPVTASLAPVVQPQAENAAAARSAEGQTSDSTAQGQFSLQAASFPTQEGADEFAERLRRAGVPSYVVPAELIRRGRWFRVRVGRFNSAEDAQRFVGEAQQRARAAGIAVQLIVCQYGQP
jgi:cell division septation protein DedD